MQEVKPKNNKGRAAARDERKAAQKVGSHVKGTRSKTRRPYEIVPGGRVIQRIISTVPHSKSEEHVKRLAAADPNIRRLRKDKYYTTEVINRDLSHEGEGTAGVTTFIRKNKTLVYTGKYAHDSSAETRATLSHELILHVLPHFRRFQKDNTRAKSATGQHRALMLGSDFGSDGTKRLRRDWARHVKRVTSQYVAEGKSKEAKRYAKECENDGIAHIKMLTVENKQKRAQRLVRLADYFAQNVHPIWKSKKTVHGRGRKP